MTALVMRAPGSKSQTQRALLLAALARGESTLIGAVACDDSRYLRQALAQLGAGVVVAPDGSWQVKGLDGRPRQPGGELDAGEGGTTLRFLAPLALLLDAPLRLNGHGRLGRRPLDGLLSALARLGVQASRPEQEQPLPLTLQRMGPAGRCTSVEVHRSSQFASALLMVGPCLPRGLDLTLDGPLVSRPYLEMTVAAMARFGVTCTLSDHRALVEPGHYAACNLEVEGDWSAGAFLLAAGWISGRALEVPNLAPDSRQGDRAMVELLGRLDQPGPRSFSLAACPDLVAPLAAACALARGTSRIIDVAHARLKESDRLAVLARGLSRAGVGVEEHPDGLTIEPASTPRPVRLDPAGDHRMAMAFGLLSLRQPGITVEDPGCVAKSYPGFWDDLARFRP